MVIRKESDLINKWLWEKHREDLQWRRVRLGALPNKEMARAHMVTLRWADAIFIKDATVYIVEAKLTPQLGAIGQLEMYKKLFYQTLEFKQFWEYPVVMVFLCPMLDVNMAELLTEKGIIYEIWPPPETPLHMV